MLHGIRADARPQKGSYKHYLHDPGIDAGFPTKEPASRKDYWQVHAHESRLIESRPAGHEIALLYSPAPTAH